MPAKTKLNVSPYWDDYNIEDDFHKILFRPGFAVQARELTQLQTILQNQIEQFGNHMFKEGTMVIPGSIAYDGSYYALKLQPTYLTGTVSAYLSEYVDSIITGETSGVTAKVIGYAEADADTGEPDTLYVKYQKTGTDNSSVQFEDGENISANKIISGYAADVISAISDATSCNATASAVTVLAGVYFVRGFMVQNTQQTLVLDRFSNTSSYRVGWLITESLVAPETDSSLLDNAQGSSNYAAKGAHRLKISLTLTKRSLETTDDENFIELVRVKNGVVERQMKYTQYNVIADMIARRTNDESGDYIVKHFKIEPREHLDDGTNRGIYTAENGGDSTKLALSISPGKAYVDGYEIELQGNSIVELNKARNTKNVNNDFVPAFLGNYAIVDNVYNQPDISDITSILTPFKTVSLYDAQTVTPGISSGTPVGYARSRAFEYNSGTIGDVAAKYHHYLFDITMFNKIVMSANVTTLTTDAVITGVNSGATAVVVAGISNATDIWVMQQKGKFQEGEAITSSVSSDDTTANTPTVAAGTFLTENKKKFSRDVKQIYMATTGTINYTSDIVLDDIVTLGGNIDTDGTTTVVGYNTTFTLDLVVGDIVSLATGAAGALEEFSVVTITDDRTIVLSGTPTTTITKIAINRLRTTLKEIEEVALVYPMPKANIKTLLDSLGVSDTSYDYRVQKTGTTNASSEVTFNTDPGDGWANPTSGRNYVLAVNVAGTGTAVAGDIIDITGNGTATAVVSGGTQLVVTDVTGLGVGAEVSLIGTANKPEALQRSKTPNIMTTKQIQSYAGGGTYQNIYGERLEDKDISLSYADVYKLHAVYESSDNGTDAVSPTLATINATGTFTIGEVITGSNTKATGRVISDVGNVISYVKLNGSFNTLDNITGGTSGHTASISTITPGDKNITGSFVLDSGQRASFYDIGRITRKPGTQVPSGRLLIIYDYFIHGTGDFFSVDSYDGQVDYEDIPYFTATPPNFNNFINAEVGIYPLRDSLDFRPRVKNQTAPTVSPFAFDSKNFVDSGSISGNIVVPDNNIRTDYDFYLGRKDHLYLTKDGNWRVVEGVPAENPKFPAKDNVDMLACEITIASYTFNPDNIRVKYLNNKGFTMRDIGNLETRISNLEYSTALALLERETDSFNVLDADGLNRFKSGFIVDNFRGHSVGHNIHEDYGCAVDNKLGHLRPIGLQKGVDFIEEATTDAQRKGLSYQRTGDIITLPYTEKVYMTQPYASRIESVNPYAVTIWQGVMCLVPDTDIWIEDERVPAVSIDLEGNYEQMLRENTESGSLGTVWGDWRTIDVLGSSTDSTTSRETNPDGSGGARNLIRTVTETTTTTTVLQEREGTHTELIERIDEYNLDRVVNTEIIPWIRSRDIDFCVSGMKPNTRLYAFFDGVDVTDLCKPINTSYNSTTLSTNLRRNDTTINVDSTEGFPNSGGLSIGDPFLPDPFGQGRVKLEEVTYTGKTATSFTGVTRNSTFSQYESKNWLSGQPVTDSVWGTPLITDDLGNLWGRFRIPWVPPGLDDTGLFDPQVGVFGPPRRFRIGNRLFRVTDSSTDSRVGGFFWTWAEKNYFAQGTLQTKQETILSVRNGELEQTSVSEERIRTRTSTQRDEGNWYDPLAQSIMVDEPGGIFITSVDLFFAKKDPDVPVWIEVRTMVNGSPSQYVLPFSKKLLQSSEVNVNDVDGTTPTTFTFDAPIYLSDLTDYAIVVRSDSADYFVWISRLGEIDIAGNRAISDQPTLGSLFKSQNASTWTASQYEDLKFTLKQADFDISNTGQFTVVNQEFRTRLDSGPSDTVGIESGDKGNGLIPQLTANPASTVSGQSKVKIKSVNHQMHATNNNVKITGITSDISPTNLDGAITSVTTSIVCQDVTNFPSSGTIRIDDELITYTGKSGITTLTGCTRGTVNGDGFNTTADAHEDGTIVHLYMIGGIPLIEVNKVHTSIEDPQLDSFILTTTTPATSTVTAGGSVAFATRNVSFDVFHPSIQTMEVENTSITAKLQTTSGTTCGNQNQTSFTKTSSTSAVPLSLNSDLYFTAPQIICSPINEANELNGGKSLRMTMYLNSSLKNISPVIDAARMTGIAKSNRVNNIDTSADINTTFSEYHPMTDAKGDNNAAIYITKKISLVNSGTAIKVFFDAVNLGTTDIRVLYKIQRLDSDEDFNDLDWTYFTGYTDLEDGLPETNVPFSKNMGEFKEYQYLAGKKVNGLGEPLDEFNAFAIKIVMQSTNSSYPPLIKDFRAIALAT